VWDTAKHVRPELQRREAARLGKRAFFAPRGGKGDGALSLSPGVQVVLIGESKQGKEKRKFAGQEKKPLSPLSESITKSQQNSVYIRKGIVAPAREKPPPRRASAL